MGKACTLESECQWGDPGQVPLPLQAWVSLLKMLMHMEEDDIGTPCVRHLAQCLAPHSQEVVAILGTFIYWSTVETSKTEKSPTQVHFDRPYPKKQEGARLGSRHFWYQLEQGTLSAVHCYKEIPFNCGRWHWAQHFSAFYKGEFERLLEFGRAAWLYLAKIQIPVTAALLVWFTHLVAKHSLPYSIINFLWACLIAFARSLRPRSEHLTPLLSLT